MIIITIEHSSIKCMEQLSPFDLWSNILIGMLNHMYMVVWCVGYIGSNQKSFCVLAFDRQFLDHHPTYDYYHNRAKFYQMYGATLSIQFIEFVDCDFITCAWCVCYRIEIKNHFVSSRPTDNF